MTDTDTPLAPSRYTSAALAALLGLGSILGVAACSDEDGVDEVTDAVDDEVDEETDALNEGDNQG